jgi:queuosine precursor transporter
MQKPADNYKYLSLLLALNVTFLLVSDFTGARIIAIHGIGVSVTVLYFPFTYLLGDVLTEVYGYAVARRVIWISAFCSVLGSAVGGAQLLVPAAAFFSGDAAYQAIFSPSLKIAVSGLVAFFAGDFCNSYVLAKMKIRDEGKRLWSRFVVSTIVGEGVNTVLFYGLALSTVLPGSLMLSGIGLGWACKVLVEVATLPLTYALVNYLKSAEGVDYFDRNTDFNPFLLR